MGKRKNKSRKRMAKPTMFKKSQIMQAIESKRLLAKFDNNKQAVIDYVNAVCNDLLNV